MGLGNPIVLHKRIDSVKANLSIDGQLQALSRRAVYTIHPQHSRIPTASRDSKSITEFGPLNTSAKQTGKKQSMKAAQTLPVKSRTALSSPLCFRMRGKILTSAKKENTPVTKIRTRKSIIALFRYHQIRRCRPDSSMPIEPCIAYRKPSVLWKRQRSYPPERLTSGRYQRSRLLVALNRPSL
jgi:hypothetical protein